VGARVLASERVNRGAGSQSCNQHRIWLDCDSHYRDRTPVQQNSGRRAAPPSCTSAIYRPEPQCRKGNIQDADKRGEPACSAQSPSAHTNFRCCAKVLEMRQQRSEESLDYAASSGRQNCHLGRVCCKAKELGS